MPIAGITHAYMIATATAKGIPSSNCSRCSLYYSAGYSAACTIACGVYGTSAGFIKMPHAFIIVPHAGFIRLVGGDISLSILQIDDRIGSVRNGRNLNPENDLAGRSVIALPL